MRTPSRTRRAQEGPGPEEGGLLSTSRHCHWGYLDHIRVIAGHDAARGREGPSRPGGEPGEAAARRENHDHQCSQRSVESEASSYLLRPARRQLNLNASVINLQFDSDCDS